MELFDLTLPLGPELPIEPGDPTLDLERVSTCETDGYEVTQIRLGSHTGTHVEAPRHFFPDGATLGSFPLARFVGQAVIFDCRKIIGRKADDAIAVRGFTDQLRWWPPLEDGLVLIWAEGGTLPLWTAEMLADAGVGLVGIDAPSIDEEPHAVHRLLLGRGILIAENLRGLDRVGAGPVECALLPLALENTDASPVRAVVWRSIRGDR